MRKDEYSGTASALHGALAVLIVFLFALSWWMMALPFGTFRQFPFQLHKNVGLTLIAVLALLLWARFRRPPVPPAISERYPRWMHRLAVVDHILLYVLVLAVCISGYLSSSFSGWATTWWGLIKLPDWGWEDERLNQLFSDVHLWTCWMLLAVIAFHIGAAVFHAFRRDGLVRRMLHL